MKKCILLLALGSIVLFAGCNKDDDSAKTTTPTPTPNKTVELAKYYKSQDGDMVIEIKGTDAVITSMPSTSDYATNSALVKVGDVFFRNITRKEDKKWTTERVKGTFELVNGKKTLTEVKWQTWELSFISDNNKSMWWSGPESDYTLGFTWDKVDNPDGTNNGSGTGGGGSTSGNGIEGDWYLDACGDPKGVRWHFDGKNGYFSNKDCNSICTPFKLKFTYTISGDKCTVTYLPQAQQDYISCTGYDDKRPAPTTTTESFTFTIDGSTMKVTSGNGPATFKR